MTEPPPPMPMADRGPPTPIEPLAREGIRYKQKIGGESDPQVGGLLAAYDEKSGNELWTLVVYKNTRDIPGLEGDVQDVFFKSMEFGPDGKILIEAEDGRKFAVDVEARTSTPLP